MISENNNREQNNKNTSENSDDVLQLAISKEKHLIQMYKSDARLAVLEKIAESHERRLTDIEDFHRSVVERLDQKIQLDSASQVAMEKTLIRAVATLDNLAATLDTALELAGDANRLAVKHETVGTTVLRLGSIAAVVIAGGWAIFKFFAIGF